MKSNVKKQLCLLLAVGLLFSMTACGSPQSGGEEKAAASAKEETRESTRPGPVPSGAEQTTSEISPRSESAAENSEASGSRILVVYFSRTGEQYTVGVIDHGNTAIVAEMIAGETGADLFEILPADDHYPMTYNELTDVAKKEQNAKARPAYAGEVPDLSQYDTIFIGAPVWWGDWPMILYTFFEENAGALAGKKLVPFSTHEGSGLSGFDKKLSSAIPGSTVLKGLAVRGNDCQNRQDSVRKSVKSWIAGLDF